MSEDRFRSIRRILVVLAILLGLVCMLPEWLGVGAAGLGIMQWSVLVAALTLGIVGFGLGRVNGRPLMSAFVLGSMISLVLALLSFADAEPGWFLWRIGQQIGGPSALGIHQEDARLGWKNVAGAEATDKHYDYVADYTLDASGFRESGPQAADGRPATTTVLCLGGSFTFGQGVADGETYPAVWDRQAGKDVDVINAGVNGWGTVQAWLFLEQYLQAHPAPQIVTYGFIPSHVNRNADRESWLAVLSQSERKKPVVRVVDGMPEFDRMIAGGEGRMASADLDREEIEVTEACLTAMDGLCRERGIRFRLLILGNDRGDDTPAAATAAHFRSFAQQAGIEYVDLSDNSALATLRFPHDGHPTAAWHEQVGEQLNASITAENP